MYKANMSSLLASSGALQQLAAVSLKIDKPLISCSTSTLILEIRISLNMPLFLLSFL